MVSGIGDFSVEAVKSGVETPKPEQKGRTGNEGPWRHFICIVPPDFGLRSPVHFNTLELDGFRSAFKLAAVLRGLKLPDGLSFGEDVAFFLGAEQVAHPERILAEQPLLSVLRSAVQLLDHCLARRLSQPDFIKALNALGLPVTWRNELAEVFAHAKPVESGKSWDPHDAVDALLASVDLGGETQAKPSAAEQFISEVGSAGTGFALNEPVTKGFRQGLEDLILDLERGLLDHKAVAGPMGLALGLNSLQKLVRGPQHLHFHLIPASVSEELYEEHWREALVEHPGAVEAWVYLTAGTAEKDPWAGPWEKRFARHSGLVLLQSEESNSQGYLSWIRSLPVAGHVFLGGVAAAVGEGHCFFKPSALAYLEALFQNKGRLPASASETMPLVDADVNPGNGSSADRVYDGESLRSLREKGLNVAVGAKNRADVVFLPLAALPR